MDSDGDYDDAGPDDTLGPSESLDSVDVLVPVEAVADARELLNASPEDDESLDERLAAEEPDVLPPPDPEVQADRRTLGQIDGTPEDGDSFYTVVDSDE